MLQKILQILELSWRSAAYFCPSTMPQQAGLVREVWHEKTLELAHVDQCLTEVSQPPGAELINLNDGEMC